MTAKKAVKSVKNEGNKIVATNRRARHEFEILETFEAGIALVGSEVKSLRQGHVQVRDAYAKVEDAEVLLHNLHIAPYAQATGFGAHDPDRSRKLLLHRYEIDRLVGKLQHDRLTLIPLSIYFKDGRAKLELGLARGRTLYDKRHVLAARDAEMEMKRVSAQYRYNR
ncbi:MAG: SsrA-binding protein SmpB [Ferrimicrobium sp.]